MLMRTYALLRNAVKICYIQEIKNGTILKKKNNKNQMAIYHYHRRIGKRSEGKNAVFAVAYIRGEKRTCPRTNVTNDFTKKQDIVYTNTFIPEDSPLWAIQLRNAKITDSKGNKYEEPNGQSFSVYAWNQIELSEKRVDSQLYFHDDIALPNALNKEQAIELVEDFVKTHLAKDGVFCDVAIHWDKDNHHFHVIMPLRTLTEDGFSKKIRFTKAQLKQEVKRIRESWATISNRKLETFGIDERIDHRSYKERGINLKPSVKMGKFNHLSQGDVVLRKISENALIREANAKAIQEEPQILSEKILQERPSFDSKAVSDEISRYALLKQESLAGHESLNPEALPDEDFNKVMQHLSDNTGIINERALKKAILEEAASSQEFERIYNKIIEHQDIYALGLGEDGRQHFVSRKAFDLEKGLLKATHQLSKENGFPVSKSLVQKVGHSFGLNEAQLRALHHLTRSGNMSLVCGFAGTGKTYMLKAAKAIWDEAGFKIIGLSTSGKAVSGLEQETGIISRTIFSFLEAVKKGQIVVDDKTILVMDEMGMTSMDDMQAVVEIAETNKAKFAGVGDIEQTQPVGRGAPFRAMVEEVGASYLDTIIRQKLAWQREATTLFETNQTALGFDLYEQHNAILLHETNLDAMNETVDSWHASYIAQKELTFDGVVMTAFKNETVDALNLIARKKLIESGFMDEGDAFLTASGSLNIAVGERLLLTKNDYKLDVKNGDFATVLNIADGMMKIRLDSGKMVDFNLQNYNHLQYGYAATVHKLQGYTGNDVQLLIDGDGWDRHKFLVGATRHKDSLTIHASKETFKDMGQLKESVSRHGLNDILMDFPVSYSKRRGFDGSLPEKEATRFIQKSKKLVFDALGYLFNYQSAIEQGASAFDLKIEEIEARRKEAVIVAEFSDNRAELGAKLEALADLSEAEKGLVQDEIYALQLRNAEIATRIKSNEALYANALERNRISKDKIDKSFDFHERHQRVQLLIAGYNQSKPINTLEAFALIDNIKTSYTHVCHLIKDKDERGAFLSAMESVADKHRRDKAFEVFGMEERAFINSAVSYKKLDYEIGKILKGLAEASLDDKKALYASSIKRDKLASEIINNPLYQDIITHFGIKSLRIEKHAGKYQDRLMVQAFFHDGEQSSLARQALAHKIKAEPKRFGIYLDEFSSDGWKKVNIENWIFERRQLIAKGSISFKQSMALIRAYKKNASMAYTQWQKAIEQGKKNSPNAKTSYKKAQGLSFKRALLAHEIMANLNQHVAALALEKVDTTRLYQQSVQVEYLGRYRNEKNEIRKLHMARYIHDNLKDFKAGLAVYGLERDVLERALHFAYLARIKAAPDEDRKALIRLSLDYQEKKVEAGILWGQVKALEVLKIDTRGLKMQAKHLMAQRNGAAHSLLSACKEQDLLTKEITGIALDVRKLERESSQHLAEQTILDYLSAPASEKGEFAKALLANKASYHLLFDKDISFEQLKKDITLFEQTERRTSVENKRDLAIEQKPVKPLWDVDKIATALMQNPIETYKAILGEPKETGANHLRYPNGLVIATKGSDAGLWYSFTEEEGGNPIGAIKKYLNLSFKEALSYGARLAGFSELDAQRTTPLPANMQKPEAKAVQQDPSLEKQKNGIVSAQSIWEGTLPLENSLAARYLREHRKIDDLTNLSIRYWPKGADWIDFDANGKANKKPNKIPAAIIAAKNADGEVVSVQRIYLDERTASKNTFLKEAKLTKGSNKGAAGIVQIGEPGGLLYIAEGPETAASIASLHAKATVLTSFSVSNISNMVDVIKAHAPKQVIIAADNDGADASSRKTTENACKVLRNTGIDARVVYPDMLPDKKKTDWNDILVGFGKDALATQFQTKVAQTQFFYEKGIVVKGSLAEQYVKNEKQNIPMDDLRFIESINLKGQSVPALVLPHYNAKNLLCGETVMALSQDGKSLISEGTRAFARDGFYRANIGNGDTLIIADSLLDAKKAAIQHTDATVLLGKSKDYPRLQEYVTELGIKPSNIMVLSENHDRETQIHIAEKIKPFQSEGTSFYLLRQQTDGLKGKKTRLHLPELEKARMKMSFEKLLQQKPEAPIAPKKQSPKECFDALKKNYPLLSQYEEQSKARNQAQGYPRELLDKELLAIAKELARDEKLLKLLKRDLPKLAENIEQRLKRSQERGIGR